MRRRTIFLHERGQIQLSEMSALQGTFPHLFEGDDPEAATLRSLLLAMRSGARADEASTSGDTSRPGGSHLVAGGWGESNVPGVCSVEDDGRETSGSGDASMSSSAAQGNAKRVRQSNSLAVSDGEPSDQLSLSDGLGSVPQASTLPSTSRDDLAPAGSFLTAVSDGSMLGRDDVTELHGEDGMGATWEGDVPGLQTSVSTSGPTVTTSSSSSSTFAPGSGERRAGERAAAPARRPFAARASSVSGSTSGSGTSSSGASGAAGLGYSSAAAAAAAGLVSGRRARAAPPRHTPSRATSAMSRGGRASVAPTAGRSRLGSAAAPPSMLSDGGSAAGPLSDASTDNGAPASVAGLAPMPGAGEGVFPLGIAGHKQGFGSYSQDRAAGGARFAAGPTTDDDMAAMERRVGELRLDAVLSHDSADSGGMPAALGGSIPFRRSALESAQLSSLGGGGSAAGTRSELGGNMSSIGDEPDWAGLDSFVSDRMPARGSSGQGAGADVAIGAFGVGTPGRKARRSGDEVSLSDRQLSADAEASLGLAAASWDAAHIPGSFGLASSVNGDGSPRGSVSPSGSLPSAD